MSVRNIILCKAGFVSADPGQSVPSKRSRLGAGGLHLGNEAAATLPYACILRGLHCLLCFLRTLHLLRQTQGST